MAYNLEPTNENVQRIARELACHGANYPDRGVRITPGFEVPEWLLHVSEAQAIWLKHTAANGLDFQGKKTAAR